jgi:hypothetical protein
MSKKYIDGYLQSFETWSIEKQLRFALVRATLKSPLWAKASKTL